MGFGAKYTSFQNDCFIETKNGQFFDPTIDHKTDGPLCRLKISPISHREWPGCQGRNHRNNIGDCRGIYDLASELYLETWPGKYINKEQHAQWSSCIIRWRHIPIFESVHSLLSRYLPITPHFAYSFSCSLAGYPRDCDVITANLLKVVCVQHLSSLLNSRECWLFASLWGCNSLR